MMPGRETVIHIVRHGATDWSDLKRHTGRSDIPLNRHGEEQAKKLAPTLALTRFDRVLSSPLVRAHRTAELAGFPDCETSALLLESDYGEDEGQTRAEIQRDRPGWDYFIDGAKGGESLEEVAARARTLIEELDGTVLLFSHAHLTRILTMAWLGKAPRDGRHLSIHPASIGILARDRDIPVIRLWNFTPDHPQGS
jgi:probable phosphoglycerate mutase